MNHYFIVLLSILFLSLGCTQADKSDTQSEVSQQDATETAMSPETDISSIELIDLKGNSISWESLRGKKVFLNFWATWCKPCIVEMPAMHEAAQQLGDEYVFLTASYEEPDKIQAFAEQRDFDFQFVHSKTPFEALNIYSIPTTFLISEEGELIETVIGSRAWNQPETINRLKDL